MVYLVRFNTRAIWNNKKELIVSFGESADASLYSWVKLCADDPSEVLGECMTRRGTDADSYLLSVNREFDRFLTAEYPRC